MVGAGRCVTTHIEFYRKPAAWLAASKLEMEKAYESNQPFSTEELRKMHAYWRAANYISVGQIYLYANPLLREPLKIEHMKPRLLGHWGTTPGLNLGKPRRALPLPPEQGKSLQVLISLPN